MPESQLAALLQLVVTGSPSILGSKGGHVLSCSPHAPLQVFLDATRFGRENVLPGALPPSVSKGPPCPEFEYAYEGFEDIGSCWVEGVEDLTRSPSKYPANCRSLADTCVQEIDFRPHERWSAQVSGSCPSSDGFAQSLPRSVTRAPNRHPASGTLRSLAHSGLWHPLLFGTLCSLAPSVLWHPLFFGTLRSLAPFALVGLHHSSGAPLLEQQMKICC